MHACTGVGNKRQEHCQDPEAVTEELTEAVSQALVEQ